MAMISSQKSSPTQNWTSNTPVSNNWLPQMGTYVPGIGYTKTQTAPTQAAPAPQAQAQPNYVTAQDAKLKAAQNTLALTQAQQQIRDARMGVNQPQQQQPVQQPQQTNALQNQLMQMLQGSLGQQPAQPAGPVTYGGTKYTAEHGGGGGGAFNSSGGPQITVAPIWSQGQVNQVQGGLRNTPVPNVPLSGMGKPAGNALAQMLADSVSGAGNAAATNFGRDAAFRNADFIRNANQSNVGRGLDFANLAASQYTSQLGYDNAQRNLLLSMLGSFV